MSYDLYFQFRNPESAPDLKTIAAWFGNRKNYEVSEKQAIYSNEATGVYFIFDLGDAGAGEEGEENFPLSFNLNYMRPHIFGLEAEPELRALITQFELLVSDPQIDGMGEGEYSTERFLSGWNTGNLFGYRAIAQQQIDEEIQFLPTAQIEACWRWNFGVDELQTAMGDDVFVPRILFLQRAGRVATAVSWPDGIPVAMPQGDVVVVGRKAILPKKFFRSQEDMVLADWSEIDPIVREFPVQQGALPYRLLAYSETPESIVSHLRALKNTGEEPVVLSVDKILNSELIAKARAQ